MLRLSLPRRPHSADHHATPGTGRTRDSLGRHRARHGGNRPAERKACIIRVRPQGSHRAVGQGGAGPPSRGANQHPPHRAITAGHLPEPRGLPSRLELNPCYARCTQSECRSSAPDNHCDGDDVASKWQCTAQGSVGEPASRMGLSVFKNVEAAPSLGLNRRLMSIRDSVNKVRSRTRRNGRLNRHDKM